MTKVAKRILFLFFAALVIPACGGGGGGPAFTGPSPWAVVTTPSGIQSSVIPISFILADPESDPITITVEYSTDGGGSFSPATPGSENGPLTGLASSPGGVAHVFLWNSVDDGVAAGTMSGLSIATVGTVNTQVQVRITPSDGVVGSADATSDFTVDNTFERALGVATDVFPHTLAAMGNSETELGNLIADAFRIRYGTQLALQNGWGIRAPLPSSFLPADTSLRRPDPGYAPGPPWDLVTADAYLTLPWSDRLITRTVTGSQLWAALEWGVSLYPSNHNGFPQISGFSFTFKESNSAGSRVLSVTLDGGAPILNDATTYTFATNDFLNAGGDGYTMLNDGQGTPRELIAEVLAEYIETLGAITPTIAGRMTIEP